MDFLTIFVASIALGTDGFSMAVGLGAIGIRRKQALMIALMVLVFHTLLPLIGLLLGSLLGKTMGKMAAIIGASVLILIGVLMLYESLPKQRKKEHTPIAMRIMGIITKKGERLQFTPGFLGIMALAVSVSIDALTVGFGLGTLQLNILLTVLIIGIIAGLMTIFGFFCGKKLGCWFGGKAQIIGGLILIAIGIKMFFI